MPDAIPVPPEAIPANVINKAVRAAGERIGTYEPGNPGFWSTFRMGLEAAAPLIAAAERQRVRESIPIQRPAHIALLVAEAVAAERQRICQLADHTEAFYPDPDAPGLTLPFADLIGDPDA